MSLWMSPGTNRKLRVLIGVKPSASKGNSGKVPETHSLGLVGDHNLGVFITEIALKIANAVRPTHFISRVPNAAYVDWCRRHPSGAPLTCLARIARRQSLSTGHLANFRTLSSSNGE
jgi:hypothetical protein